NGSVIVHYELAVKKETAGKTLNTIVETVKKVAKEDSFGNFTVDADSVSAKKTDLYSYYGRLTIGNRLYNEELADVHTVFASSLNSGAVIAVTNITFSNGSVIVRYLLLLKEKHTLDELTQIMRDYLKAHNGTIGSFQVKAGSISFSGNLIIYILQI
ncbi:hypothetical protein NP493_7980g00000, partial [Ridgeia piscesae]